MKVFLRLFFLAIGVLASFGALRAQISIGGGITQIGFPPPGTSFISSNNQLDTLNLIVHTNVGGNATVNTITANGASEGEKFVALQRSPGDTGVCPTTAVPQGYDACLQIAGTGSPLTIASFNNLFSGTFTASLGTSGVAGWTAGNSGSDSAIIGITLPTPAGCSKAFGGGNYALAPAGNECTFIDSSLQNNTGTGTGGVIAATGITAFSYSPTSDILAVGVTPKPYVQGANSAGTSVTTTIGDNSLTPSTTTITAGTSGGVRISNGPIATGTVFTVSGCGTPTAVGGTWSGHFTAGATACNPVITLSTTAPNWWHCRADDETTAITFRQTAHSATSATLTASGAATTSDVIDISCDGH